MSPQYLGRSLSTGLGPDSDRGYDSYRAGTCRSALIGRDPQYSAVIGHLTAILTPDWCSVHGTLKRHVSSSCHDTTAEEDTFDTADYNNGEL